MSGGWSSGFSAGWGPTPPAPPPSTTPWSSGFSSGFGPFFSPTPPPTPPIPPPSSGGGFVPVGWSSGNLGPKFTRGQGWYMDRTNGNIVTINSDGSVNDVQNISQLPGTFGFTQ